MIVTKKVDRSISRTSVKLALDIIRHNIIESDEQSNVIREEVAFEIQKDMIRAGLVMPLTAVTVVDKNEIANDDELNSIILKLLSQNEVFQYRYTEVNNEIILKVKEAKKDLVILKLSDVREQDVQNIIQTTNGVLIKELSKNYLNSKLYFVYVIQSNSKYCINFVISHIIADAGINTAINRAIREIITNDEYTPPQYKDYVSRIKQTPRENGYSLIVKNFISINKENKNKLELLLEERELLKESVSVSLKNWDYVLFESAFVVGKRIINYTGIMKLVMKVSYNFRNAFDEKYQSLIGDCHSYFFVMMKSGDTLEEFCKRNFEYLDLIRKEKIECGYFRSVEDSVYMEIYDSTKVNINLMTDNYLCEDDVIQYLDSSLALNQKLLNSSIHRIDIALFKKNYYMYISKGVF